MNGFAQGEQKLAVPMRIMGILLVVTSIIEYGVGGAAYEFLSSVHVGGWWGGIGTIIAAVFALISNNRCVIISGCILAVIAIIVAVIAAIADGAQALTINQLTGCIEPTTGQSWGSSNGISNARLCYLSGDDAFDYYGGRTSECVCSNDNGGCFGYTLATGTDCNTLFTVYYDELSASCAFCVLLAILSLIYAVFTCINFCSAEPPPRQQTPTVTGTGNVAPVSVATGTVMYAPAPGPVQTIQYSQPSVGPVVYAPGFAPTLQGQVLYQHPPQQQQQQQQQPQYVYQTGGGPSAPPGNYEPQQSKWG